MDRATIARTYLRSWFLIDLVSAIPWSELLTSPSFGFAQLFKVRLCSWCFSRAAIEGDACLLPDAC